MGRDDRARCVRGREARRTLKREGGEGRRKGRVGERKRERKRVWKNEG